MKFSKKNCASNTKKEIKGIIIIGKVLKKIHFSTYSEK